MSFSLKMLQRIEARSAGQEMLTDRDFEGVISESEETECADDIWEYYEAHKDELEDLDEYAGKRGLVKHVVWIDNILFPNRAFRPGRSALLRIPATLPQGNRLPPADLGPHATGLPRATAHARERARPGVRGRVRWLAREESFLAPKAGSSSG
ncbi:MAG: hypothetical protein WCW68_03835 [Methanothrix sp.]